MPWRHPITDEKKGMHEREAKEILKQIANGCLALAKNGTNHGFLRPS